MRCATDNCYGEAIVNALCAHCAVAAIRTEGDGPHPDPVEVRARRLLEGVTRGPWSSSDKDFVIATTVSTGDRWYGGKHLVAESIFRNEDRKFIAACRDLVPALCDEIERLRRGRP